MTMKLWQMSRLIRSKNAGPFELTFDIILKDAPTYQRVKDLGLLNEELISSVYRVDKELVQIIYYPAASAIKITIPRAVVSGDLLDSDVYGGQQHAPLVDIEVPDAPS